MHADRDALRSSGTRRVVTLILAFASALAAAPPAAAADVQYFYVVNPGTRMMAEVLASRTDDGAPVVLSPNDGGASQQFSVQRLSRSGNAEPFQEQWFLLRARHSGKCLKTSGFQPGATVVQDTCSGDASQLWRLRAVVVTAAECPARSRCFGARRTVLENYHDRGRRCLDMANGQFPGLPEQGANLQARDCATRSGAPNAANQQWDLVDVQNWDAPFVFR
jgi:Ricin-type beta-trefoil lectin domain